MEQPPKPLVWLQGEIKTPPISKQARLEAGFLPRQLQNGERLTMPASRPMAQIGLRCHELRINDENMTWRIIYRIDEDAILILEVFEKKSRSMPRRVIEACKRRIRQYDE